jgi:hypothetical protein
MVAGPEITAALNAVTVHVQLPSQLSTPVIVMLKRTVALIPPYVRVESSVKVIVGVGVVPHAAPATSADLHWQSLHAQHGIFSSNNPVFCGGQTGMVRTPRTPMCQG